MLKESRRLYGHGLDMGPRKNEKERTALLQPNQKRLAPLLIHLSEQRSKARRNIKKHCSDKSSTKGKQNAGCCDAGSCFACAAKCIPLTHLPPCYLAITRSCQHGRSEIVCSRHDVQFAMHFAHDARRRRSRVSRNQHARPARRTTAQLAMSPEGPRRGRLPSR